MQFECFMLFLCAWKGIYKNTLSHYINCPNSGYFLEISVLYLVFYKVKVAVNYQWDVLIGCVLYVLYVLYVYAYALCIVYVPIIHTLLLHNTSKHIFVEIKWLEIKMIFIFHKNFVGKNHVYLTGTFHHYRALHIKNTLVGVTLWSKFLDKGWVFVIHLEILTQPWGLMQGRKCRQ